jgi:hypothetical protein
VAEPDEFALHPPVPPRGIINPHSCCPVPETADSDASEPSQECSG